VRESESDFSSVSMKGKTSIICERCIKKRTIERVKFEKKIKTDLKRCQSTKARVRVREIKTIERENMENEMQQRNRYKNND